MTENLPRPHRVPTSVAVRTNRKKRAFLTAFAKCYQVTAAAAAVRLSPSAIYRWRKDKNDPDFARAFDEISATISDIAESETIRRAVAGWDEPVFYGGERCGTVRRFSDSLLMQLNRARNPLYKDGGSQISISTNVGIALFPMVAASEEDWEVAALRLAADQQKLSAGEVVDGTAEHVETVRRG